MAVSRLTTETLAAEVAATYSAVELRLLRLIAKHLAAGTEVPGWAEAKMQEVQLFRRRAEREVAEALSTVVPQVSSAVVSAYVRGAAAAEAELIDLDRETDRPVRHAERAVAALVASVLQVLEGLPQQIVRQSTDAYMRAVARASAGTLTGSTTRLQDAQQALDVLAKQGVAGFTDKSGRRWQLESYVEMATRSTTARAAVAGHLDRLEDAGLSLVIVSDSPRECEKCRPWEGKVLSRGPVGALQRNVLTGTMERVRIDGTVDDAIRAGLMHPGCTHSFSAYVHGATKRPSGTSNAKGYEDKQRLRAMERHVREWKRREAAAVTPEAQRKARGKAREWQGAIRDHVATTGVQRKRNREQLGTAR